LAWRTYSLSSLNKEERGHIPRVKEVKGAANMGPHPGKSNSRKTYVAVTNFTPTQAGELSLAEGDLVEGKGVHLSYIIGHQWRKINNTAEVILDVFGH
jgi:hypothetical protein